MTDRQMLHQQLETLAEGRLGPPLPPLDRIEAAAARLDRAAQRRRVGAAVSAVMVLLVLTVNLIQARRDISVVAGQPLEPGGAAPAPTHGDYTAVGTGGDWVVWLAADRSGSSGGCVSVQPPGGVPPDDLPNQIHSPTIPNTLCASGANDVGYMIRLPGRGKDATSIGFGFVPATADHVLLTFERRGPSLLRFVSPDQTVKASTYGHHLGLPIVAWVGSDPEGYNLTRLRAMTASGEVIAEWTSGLPH